MLTIAQIKKAVTPICERYGVKKMWLFGSYARGEADEKSDVDLVSKEVAGKKFLNIISKDEVLLYERNRHFRQGATE